MSSGSSGALIWWTQGRAAERVTTLSDVTEFPLCWPDNKERSAKRQTSLFQTTMAKARAEIDDEMTHWHAIEHVISCTPTDRRGLIDRGVALWWSMHTRTGAALQILACDRYSDAADNLHATALTLEASRGCVRWGATGASRQSRVRNGCCCRRR